MQNSSAISVTVESPRILLSETLREGNNIDDLNDVRGLFVQMAVYEPCSEYRLASFTYSPRRCKTMAAKNNKTLNFALSPQETSLQN